MKEKCFKLLKEQMLFATAGAWNSMDIMIDYTIDIYCEMTGANKEEFIRTWKEIYNVVWKTNANYLCDSNAWEKCQKQYELLLDVLEVK